MATYNNVLLATDFNEQCEVKIKKASLLAQQHQANLILLHVVESIPESSIGYIMSPDIEQKLMDEAKQQMRRVAQLADITEENCYVEVGSPKQKIIQVAKDLNIDLIIVGSHGRHGLALLLGSTAASVLHGADCDVLTIKTK